MKKNKTENKTTQPKKHSKKKFTILALLAGAIALPIYWKGSRLGGPFIMSF